MFGFTYIAENYQRSVFKIVITTDEGDSGIGTGFLFNLAVDEKVWSLIITNEHVARHHKGLQVLHTDDRTENCKEVVCSQRSDVAAIILETSLGLPSFHLYSDPKILDDVITVGYPPVPTTKHSYQLVHKGEINSFVTDYWQSDYFLFSARTSPGNSGGPVINDMGMVVGIVTQQLLEKDAQNRGKLPYFAAVPSNAIIDFLNEEVVSRLE